MEMGDLQNKLREREMWAAFGPPRWNKIKTNYLKFTAGWSWCFCKAFRHCFIYLDISDNSCNKFLLLLIHMYISTSLEIEMDFPAISPPRCRGWRRGLVKLSKIFYDNTKGKLNALVGPWSNHLVNYLLKGENSAPCHLLIHIKLEKKDALICY